jgi:hypothetical protein
MLCIATASAHGQTWEPLNTHPSTLVSPPWNTAGDSTSATLSDASWSRPEKNGTSKLNPWADESPSSSLQVSSPHGQIYGGDVDSLDISNIVQNQRVGYDRGFIIASREVSKLESADFDYRLKINGWGQLRLTNFSSSGPDRNFNQFQLKRARLIFSGHAFTPDFSYFVAFDGRSASNDSIRLLDYYLSYDVGRHEWNLPKGTLVAKVGQYKIPFTLARAITGKEFQFTDRSVASMFFDANRSLAVGLYGERNYEGRLFTWETAIFNGLITGGAETGSTGTLDNNFAVSARLAAYPLGDWGDDDLCDWEYHAKPVVRIGTAFAASKINREGSTEFSEIRVIDTGRSLSSLLPFSIDEFQVASYCVDYSHKYRGWSFVGEYYFRNINSFQGGALPDLFDHGFWLQSGYFLIPQRLEVLARWSRVTGNSGTLGGADLSSDERAVGLVRYFRQHAAKLTVDATYLDGAPVNSFALDIAPGAIGWLMRTQVQFSF